MRAGVRRRPQPGRVLRQRRGRHASRSPTRCGSSAGAAATCRRRCRSAPARWRRFSASTPTACAQACADAAQGEVVSPANINGARADRDRRQRRPRSRAPASAPRRSAPGGSMPLPVSAPFHCALMKPAEDRLAPELRALAPDDPRGADRRERGRRAETRPPRTRSRRSSRRCRRRCAGRPSSAALRQRASQRMLRWVRARS